MKHALDMVKEVQDYEAKKLAEKQAKENRETLARKGEVELNFWQRWTFRGLKKDLQDGMRYLYDDNTRFNLELRSISYYSNSDYIFWNNYCAFYLEQHGYLDVKTEHYNIGDRYRGMRISGRLPKSLAEQVLFGTRTK